MAIRSIAVLVAVSVCLLPLASAFCKVIDCDTDIAVAFPEAYVGARVSYSSDLVQTEPIPHTYPFASQVTNGLADPLGAALLKTDCCQVFMNVLSAHVQYVNPQVSGQDWSEDGRVCANEVTSITFSYRDTRDRTAVFERKVSRSKGSQGLPDGVFPSDSGDNGGVNPNGIYNYEEDVLYEINTANSPAHPYIVPYAVVGIKSFEMGGFTVNVNQEIKIQPYVLETSSQSGYRSCTRHQIHSFYVRHEDIYLEVLVQETQIPY